MGNQRDEEQIYDYWLVDINDPELGKRLIAHTREEVKSFILKNSNTENKEVRWLNTSTRSFLLQELNDKQWNTIASASSYNESKESLPEPSDKTQALLIVRQMILKEDNHILKTHTLDFLDRLLSKLVL